MVSKDAVNPDSPSAPERLPWLASVARVDAPLQALALAVEPGALHAGSHTARTIGEAGAARPQPPVR
ncbi:MAG: hypothetical protein ACK5OA_13245 [Acidovorax sp.]